MVHQFVHRFTIMRIISVWLYFAAVDRSCWARPANRDDIVEIFPAESASDAVLKPFDGVNIAGMRAASSASACKDTCQSKWTSRVKRICNKKPTQAAKVRCRRNANKKLRQCKKKCPKCISSRGSLQFLGLEYGYSLDEDSVTLSWEASEYVSKNPNRPFLCDETEYLVFFGPTGFAYNTSVEDIIAEPELTKFSTDSPSGGQIGALALTKGQTYSVLAVARAIGDDNEEIFSSNRDAIEVLVSATTPTIKDEESWKGALGTTDSLEIIYDEASQELLLSGSPLPVGGFEANDRFQVLTADNKSFLFQVDEVVQQTMVEALLKVQRIALDEVFEKLSLDVSVDFSRFQAVTKLRRHLATETLFERTISFEETEEFEEEGITVTSKLNLAVYVRATIVIGVFVDTVAAVEVGGTMDSLSSVEFFKSLSEEKEIQRTLWEAPFKLRITIVVGVVVIWIDVDARTDVKAAAAIDLEASAKVELSQKGNVRLSGGYKEDNWFIEPAGSFTHRLETDVQGKASASAMASLYFVIDVDIESLVGADLYLEVGFEWQAEAEAVLDNPVLMQAVTPFMMTKYDVVAVVDVGVVGTSVFGDSDELEARLVERPILSLPEIWIEPVEVNYCTGTNAIELVVEAKPKSVSIIPNRLLPSHIWLDDFSPTESLEESDPVAALYELSEDNTLRVIMGLAKGIDSSLQYSLPSGKLWLRTTPMLPATLPVVIPYMLVNSSDLDSLFPSVESFECCDDSDCALRYPDEDRTCNAERSCEAESECGDGVCDRGESISSCPEDCCDGTDPCCDSDDPCCGIDDPCCGSSNPCCGSSDPCCGSSDPCCGSSDPCCGQRSGCDTAGANGDPHMFSFDGLRYSCQAKGDFVLFKASSGPEVHVRFKKKSSLVSLATGVAVKAEGAAPTVELVISEADGSTRLRINGSEVDPRLGYEDEFYVVSGTSEYKIFLKAFNMALHAGIRLPGVFTHFSTRVTLPPGFKNGATICGLLGTPDGDSSNDWAAPDCSPINVPTSYNELHYQAGYDYCVTNWCIRSETESLFTYSAAFPFEFYTGCDEPYPGDVDVSSVSNEVRTLCGRDVACLIDGAELGSAGAQNLLESESSVGEPSQLRATPSTIVTGRSVSVALTVNLSDASDLPVNLISFAVYRVDPETREIGSTSIISLLDTGSGLGHDTAANDGIFSGVVPVLSDEAGQAFGFKAIPVIGGVEDDISSLVVESLNAVRSYSSQSGIGDTSNATATIVVDSIADLVLVVDYTWPTDLSDLDTGTSFLDEKVGWACDSGSSYLFFSDDDTSNGGKETVWVSLGDSFDDGAWADSVSVDFFAGWFGCPSRGPATLSIYTEATNTVSFAINPACQSGCSSHLVGQADITIESDGRVVIAFFPVTD